MTGLALSQKLFGDCPLRETEVLAVPLAMAAALLFWAVPETLDAGGRNALTITAFAVIGWTMTRVPDSLVAIAAALALVLTGTLPEERLFASLGRELVWLLVAAFVIASVLKTSGLMELLVARALVPFGNFTSVAYVLTFMITATAFFIPSTSGRAALLLPVFLALKEQLPDTRLIRPLALLFPTVILLSAGGSLLGAGAHLIAVDAIARSGGATIGYLEWMLLGLPVSLISSLLATGLILWLFVPADLRRAPLALRRPPAPLGTRQKRLALILITLLALWVTTGLHHVSIVVIALGGALTLLAKPFTDRKAKDVFRDVDLELILYLTATIVIADAMIVTGADRWLADGMLSFLPEAFAKNRAVAVGFMALIAVLSHLVITSRSARAAVLIPAVALPIAAFGHDPALIVMVAVLGTGYCQTMMASAKPVAIYGTMDQPTFAQRDLFRLALPLMPAVALPLCAAALILWPWQLGVKPASLTPSLEIEITMIEGPTLTQKQFAIQHAGGGVSAAIPLQSARPVPRPNWVSEEPGMEVTTIDKRPIASSRRITQLEADLRAVGRDIGQVTQNLRQRLGLR